MNEESDHVKCINRASSVDKTHNRDHFCNTKIKIIRNEFNKKVVNNDSGSKTVF